MLPSSTKFRYVNMADKHKFDYEEELLKEIDDTPGKTILVLEHFTFAENQVSVSITRLS